MNTAAATTLVDPRTRVLLEAPIAPTLLRLAAPNVLVMLAQAGVGLIETYFVESWAPMPSGAWRWFFRWSCLCR